MERILKIVIIVFSSASFVVFGSLVNVHSFTYWSLAIFDLSAPFCLLFITVLYFYSLYQSFHRHDIQKISKGRKVSILVLCIMLPLLIVFFIFNGKLYIQDIPNAISKKYAILKNAQIMKADFHQGTGRAATLNTYYDVLVKEADGKPIKLEVYTNFDIIRGKRTLTKYNISYFPHSKEIVSVSLSKNQISTKPTDESGTTSSTVQSSHQTASVQKQDYLSELNMIQTDYNKVRNEYNQYHTQYLTKSITISRYRDSISALMAPLDFDNTQVRYLQDIAPANALNMIQKLNDSINNFYAYIELLVDSLKTSNHTETRQALPYLTKSDHAFQEFNALHQAYISNK